jgi:hypothetical protein
MGAAKTDLVILPPAVFPQEEGPFQTPFLAKNVLLHKSIPFVTSFPTCICVQKKEVNYIRMKRR